MRQTDEDGRVTGAVDQLQRALDGLVNRKGVAHAILVVESTDGSFRWQGAAGDADGRGRSMTTATPYRLASVTKTYAAAVALRLHERGELELDEPLTAYLPDSITAGLHTRDDSDHSHEITVRHLLANTSGLANYFEDRPKDGRSLAEQLFSDGDRGWSTEEVAEMLRRDLRPFFPPGRGVRYSDTNFQLLEAVIESICAKPFAAVLRTEIIEPLGLTVTWLEGEPPPTGAPEPADLFVSGRPLRVPKAMASIGAQGALISTADESIRFLRALIDGRLFSRPETLEEMLSGWRRFGLPTDAAAVRAPSWPIEYGLGVMRFKLPRLLNGLRPMPALIGHSGSSGSWLFHAPEVGLWFAGTVDEVTSGAVPYRLLPRLLRQLSGSVAATR
jgi:D-alanyl-D-alanine carboxypeptidase